MAATIYYDKDADLSALKGKTVAIIGYGSQGHAQAQNLRDSGVNVVIGQRPGGKNYDLAVSHGFKPVSAAEATKQADVINILVPDELQGDLFKNEIQPNLKPGDILMCSHGFNLHFGFVKPPAGVDALLVAPKGPGHLVRSEFVAGGGVPCLIAMSDGASDDHVQNRPGLRQSHRRHAGRRHSHHDRRGNRNRPLRRTGRPLRRGQRPREGRLRNARRSRLPARDGLLRVHARVEADRRPLLPGRPQLHALQRQQHGRVRRLHPRPAHHHRRNQAGDEADSQGSARRHVRQGMDRRSQIAAARTSRR